MLFRFKQTKNAVQKICDKQKKETMYFVNVSNIYYVNFLKRNISFSIMKSYCSQSFDKNSSETESIALKYLIELKDLVSQKSSKGSNAVITKSTKYLKGIKNLLSYRKKITDH